ncbi:triacylglycerol lipase OBL1-like [Nymphaea colorata]|nr:triacylglycerol lipase OBL1-like [Nymphaea colorata]
MATSVERGILWNAGFLVVHPEHGGFTDLFSLLFFKQICRLRFVECSDGTTLEFPDRWVLFVSIVAQKIFLLFKRPMAWTGSMLGFALNLLPENGGLLGFLRNLLRGQIITPNEKSPRFQTVVSLLDGRTDLGDYTGSGNSMAHASLSAMASKLVYENSAVIRDVINNQWQQMEFVEFLNCWNEPRQSASTQAVIFRDKLPDSRLIVVAFRGTQLFDAGDWCTDVDLSWYEMPPMGRVHGGFLKALGVDPCCDSVRPTVPIDHITHPLAYYAIRDRLRALLKDHENARFILTGHSMGGALAVLFPAVLVLDKQEDLLERLAGVYTFGQPRVGDRRFGDHMERVIFNKNGSAPEYYRFVYCNDMVPRLPRLHFKHFGTCVYYNSLYQPQITRKELDENYFSLRNVIPLYLNAAWELVRGVFIGPVIGKEYREGWIQLIYRAFGLVVPVLPPHGLRDYVNSTKLGPIDLRNSKLT